MAINFPDSPTNGQVATIGGKNYTYDSTKNTWTPTQVTEADLSSVGSTTVVATHDLLPSSPSAGDMALVSSVNKMYVYFLSGWWLMSSLQNASPSGITGNAAIYDLAADGTPTTVTLSSSDPEGFPISWSHSVISGSLGGTTVTNVDNVFTITPSTDAADAGTFTLRFAATDGQGGESGSQSNFTLDFVFIVANSRYTTLLATAVDTSDNNNITDASTNNHSITVNGDAHAGTFSPYRSGGYSTYFDGTGDPLYTGDYLRTPTINLSGNFTIEFFINLNAITTDVGIFSFGTLSSTNSILELYNNTSGQFRLYSSSGGELGASSAVEANKWYHVAITRSSNTFKAYLDGVEFADDTTARTINSAITIGGYVNTSYLMNGHIRDFRITTNIEYPSNNFTPPSEPLTAITGTVLLTCHLPYISDGSTNDHTITVNGDPETKPFSPYDYSEYSATDHGGSINFDGTGDDYLTIPDHSSLNFASNDWTIECWIYPRTSIGDSGIWHQSASGIDWFSIYLDGSFNPKFVLKNYNSVEWAGAAAANTAPQNAWTHLSLVRQFGTGIYLYANGKLIASNTTNASVAMEDKTHDHVIGHERFVGNGQDFDGLISDFKMDIGTAHYTGEFTPPTAPLSSSGASLHIKGTDASIIDKSQGTNLKPEGNTTGSTTTNFTGAKSMYFDGSGDYLSTLSSDLLSMGTGDFTVECWVNKSLTNHKGIWQISSTAGGLQSTNYGQTLALGFQIGIWQLYAGGGSAGVNGPNFSLSTDTWYHTAVVRNSGTTKLYIDGTEEISISDSHDYTGTYMVIGGYYSTSYLHHGYIQDLRVTKGLARYTTNFTPPTTSLEG